jgi:translation elongation factor EF-4
LGLGSGLSRATPDPCLPRGRATSTRRTYGLGDIGVGKTSLARRRVFDKFDADYKTTIGVDVLTHDIELGPECESEVLRLVLWDTDGDFGSRIFETVYLAGASGAIIVADASRPGTLVKMTTLADRFAEHFPGRPVVMIVNKIDLAGPCFESGARAPRDVLYSSAKTGEGVSELFQTLGAAVWRRAR